MGKSWAPSAPSSSAYPPGRWVAWWIRDMTDRIRGRRLQRIRAQVLRDNPLCVMCKANGRVTLATQVDHIKALVNGGTDTADNRQGLCDECHRVKTAQDMGYKERAKFDAQGRVVW